MKDITPYAGTQFQDTVDKGYMDVLNERENSITFKFNGVRVIMFKDLE